MGIARSTYYEVPRATLDDTALVGAIGSICDEFEAYGWRRLRATLRQQGASSTRSSARLERRGSDSVPRKWPTETQAVLAPSSTA
jgi:putative transposase